MTRVALTINLKKIMTLPNENNLALAEAYYTAMAEKDLVSLEKYLHPDVEFVGPIACVTGKENFLQTIKGFISFFKSLTIRSKFASGNQAMLAYDVDFPAPIGITRSAALMTFKNGLIKKIELFFDASSFRG